MFFLCIRVFWCTFWGVVIVVLGVVIECLWRGVWRQVFGVFGSNIICLCFSLGIQIPSKKVLWGVFRWLNTFSEGSWIPRVFHLFLVCELFVGTACSVGIPRPVVPWQAL